MDNYYSQWSGTQIKNGLGFAKSIRNSGYRWLIGSATISNSDWTNDSVPYQCTKKIEGWINNYDQPILQPTVQFYINNELIAMEYTTSITGGVLQISVTSNYKPIEDVYLYVSNNCGCYIISNNTIRGLGSLDPNSVTFEIEDDLFNGIEEVTKDGNIFIKFPKMYRKVNTYSDDQITSITLSRSQIDDSYQVYPCFLKEDGVTEMDYILMGKYCCSSTTTANSVNATANTMAIGSGRSLCQNLGTGYQQMDWMIYKLWQDLLITKMKTVNTNSGSGIKEDALGICWYQDTRYTYPWIDGTTDGGGYYNFCYKPLSYIDKATSSTFNYNRASYTHPTASSYSGQEIQKLGYDASHPFFNYPSELTSNSSFNTYYCDTMFFSTNSKENEPYPVHSNVGAQGASLGAFICLAHDGWSAAHDVRLCYRPIHNVVSVNNLCSEDNLCY